MKINSHNEWDRLRTVIIGSVEGMSVGMEFPNQNVTQAEIDTARRVAKKAVPEWYVQNVAEDLENICDIIRKFGAEVIRPQQYGTEHFTQSPCWSATGKDLYNVRDLHIVIGNTVVASPSSVRFRYFEHDGFYDIFCQYLDEGFKWIFAPRPRLKGDYLVPLTDEENRVFLQEDRLHEQMGGKKDHNHYKLDEKEILFDAANIIKVGKDLVYLISSTGNRKGAVWLQNILGDEYRVHTTTTYRSSHLDSTILPLRPGLVLINSARVTEDRCPEVFKKWDKIWWHDMAPIPQEEMDFQRNIREPVYKELKAMGINTDLNHMSSPFAGLNVLSLDPRTVLVQDRQVKLINELERHNMSVVPVSIRHCYTMLGGLHCSSLDLVRDSKLERY